jgi:threonine synthase
MIDRLPRLLGVQAAEVHPLKFAMEHGALPPPSDGKTIADSIDVQVPRNWRKAVNALRDADGKLITANDDAILEAMRLAGRNGVFAEPAAAAALAGVVAAIEGRIIAPHERVVTMITGSGLKDTRSAIRAGGKPIPVEANVAEVAACLKEKKKT